MKLKRRVGRVSPAALVAEFGLALLVSALPAALGGAHRPVIAVAALVAAGTIAAAVYHRRQTELPFRFTVFGALLLGLTAYTALQVLPLPLWLLRVVSPASVELLETSLARLGPMPGWHPISLEPGSTLWETLKLGTATAAFLAAANLLGRSARRTRVLLVLVGTGVVLSLLGFLGAVVAPHRPLLFYAPATGPAAGLIVTSFVNPNHGSAFLTLCTGIAAGLALRQRDLQRRALIALAGVLLGTSVFLSLSRGGIVALGLFLGLFALLLWRKPQEGDEASRQTVFLAGTMGGIIGLAGWLAYDGIVSELASLLPGHALTLGKVEVWPAGLAMIASNWIVGIGRGAMASALPRYLTDFVPTVTFTHLENQYLHLPAEWGLLAGTAAIAGAAVAWATWLRNGRRDPLQLAAAAAVFAVAAHNAVDFNLELSGIAVPMAVLTGMLAAGVATPPGPLEPRPGSGKAAALAYALAAALAAGGIALLGIDLPSPDDDATRLQVLSEKPASFNSFLEEAKQAIRRHPADYLFPQLIAREAFRAKRPETLAWLNQALALFPRSPDVHLQTAQALRRFGRPRQALLHARIALESGAPPTTVLSWALPICRSESDLLRLLPGIPEVQQIAIDSLLQSGRVELAWRGVQHARRRSPSDHGLIAAEVRVRRARGDHVRALEMAERLAREHPTEAYYRLWAVAAEQLNGPTAAAKVLEQAVERFSGSLEPAFALALTYVRAKRFARATQVANNALARAEDPAHLARAHSVLSDIYRAAGRVHRADYEAERARRLSGGPDM